MQGGNTKMQLTPGMHMLAAAEAGILTLTMTNPIWVVKTRLCLQYGSPVTENALVDRQYKGMLDALIKISKKEGIRGLYKGFVPGIWGVSHGAIQFMAYEELKNSYNQYRNQAIDTKLVSVAFMRKKHFEEKVVNPVMHSFCFRVRVNTCFSPQCPNCLRR